MNATVQNLAGSITHKVVPADNLKILANEIITKANNLVVVRQIKFLESERIEQLMSSVANQDKLKQLRTTFESYSKSIIPLLESTNSRLRITAEEYLEDYQDCLKKMEEGAKSQIDYLARIAKNQANFDDEMIGAPKVAPETKSKGRKRSRSQVIDWQPA